MEHGYTPEQYIHDYDVLIPAMIEAVGGYDHAPQFMGLAYEHASICSEYTVPFLNNSEHLDPAHVPPIDYVSLHYYSSGVRDDPNSFLGFFAGADDFIAIAKEQLVVRDASSMPHVRFDFDELGIILSDDNTPGNNQTTGGIPPSYWNAAGAHFAYIFAHLAPEGVGILGSSQLAGSPEIPEWGIPLPQYPSVSLLDWNTGYGNARYWVLKLLIEEFAPGDKLLSSKFSHTSGACAASFCGEVTGPAYGSVSISCCDTAATIESIKFADWGTVQGQCGTYASDRSCTTPTAAAWVSQQCVGHNSCSLTPFPALGDPCVNVLKKFVVQANCSGSSGGTGGAAVTPVSLAAISSLDGLGKVLIVNPTNEIQYITLPDFDQTGNGHIVQLRIVDGLSVTLSSAAGIREETLNSLNSSGIFTLQPFAVVVARYTT